MEEAKKAGKDGRGRKPYSRPKVVATYTRKELVAAVKPHGSTDNGTFFGAFSP